MPLIDVRNPKLNFSQKMIIKQTGCLYAGTQTSERFKEPTPYFIIHCKKHGYIGAYPQGFHRYGKNGVPVLVNGNYSTLYCPKCREEKKK